MVRSEERSFTCTSADRVDKAASENGVQRSVFSRPDTRIEVNGRIVKKSCRVVPGDRVRVTYTEDVFQGLEAQDIPLDSIYEDGMMLVIDKPQGLVVHPAAGNWDNTVCNALLYRYGDSILSDDDDIRPGIVHRLDKDTSGVMVVAKTPAAHAFLSAQFKERNTRKYYIAVAEGMFEKRHGIIEQRIARSIRDRKLFAVTDDPGRGKEARTEYSVVRQMDGCALLLIRIYTGRTHQIRVHLASIGHPIVGDVLYNRRKSSWPLMLHSALLFIRNPGDGRMMSLRSEVPRRFRDYLAEYGDAGLEDVLVEHLLDPDF